MPAPTIGRVVLYTLSQQDAEQINKRRDDYARHMRTAAGRENQPGYAAHVGNTALPGDTYPAVIVRVFGPTPENRANLSVLLDGTDTYWATSRTEGDGEGEWSWPTRK
jgi:hypothetical protein